MPGPCKNIGFVGGPGGPYDPDPRDCMCVACNTLPRPLMYEAKVACWLASPTVSDFPVGAAALLHDGQVVRAANVENITLNLTQCAERNLVMHLVQHKLQGNVRAIAVYGPKSDSLSPCGSCRQLMSEYLSPDVPVYFMYEGEVVVHTVKELLPFSPKVKL